MGSSSLQTALSAAPSTRHYRYVAWNRDGSFQPVDQRATDGMFGYVASGFQASDLAMWNSEETARARHTLRELAESRPVVLSGEAWGGQLGVADVADDRLQRARQIFGTPELECEAVLYVRPQAPWVESAYLQFGMWLGNDVDAYAQHLIEQRSGDWELQARRLEEVGFASVRVRYANDVVTDFMAHITGDQSFGVGVASAVHANPRVSLDLLLLMLQIPELRREPGLPDVEMFVQRHAEAWGLTARPVPPVIGGELARRITDEHAECNAALEHRLPREQAQAYQARLQQFQQEREGLPTLSRQDLASIPIDPAYRDALLTALLDDAMTVRYGTGVPQELGPDSWVDRPALRGRLTSDLRWMNNGWIGRARTSAVGEWLVPRNSQRSQWAESVVSRLRR